MLRKINFSVSGLVCVILGIALWVFAQMQEHGAKRFSDREMETAVSVPLQIVLSGGDRYLAANIGSWRSTVLGAVHLQDFTLSALVKIQEDASWLNPAHEDNYYTATAVLPWEGYVAPTQVILKRAMEMRRGDPFPAFYYGFNALNFEGDSTRAAEALRMAAREVDDNGAKIALFEMATRWEHQGADSDFALKILTKAFRNARSESLRVYLDRQVKRIEGLAKLQRAIKIYTMRTGNPPVALSQLVETGAIDRLPDDPLNLGYGLRNGTPYLLSPNRE